MEGELRKERNYKEKETREVVFGWHRCKGDLLKRDIDVWSKPKS